MFLWLRLPPERQWQSVLYAWSLIPRHAAARKRRRKLIARFRKDPAPPLSAAERRELPAWRYLGLWDGNALTPLGRIVCGHDPAPPPPEPPAPWEIRQDDTLCVPLPADWESLWQVERFLEPRSPGIYPLDARALGSRLPPEGAAPLWELLTRNLAQPPPSALRARLESRHAIHILPGVVLAFPDSHLLRRLRRTASLRKRLHRIISPRHVLVTPEERRQLEPLLARRGIWLRESAVPPSTVRPRRKWKTYHPLALPLPGEDLTTALQAAITRQSAVEFRYQASDRDAPEWRHVTPLLLEQRGAHTYLTAYCHDRSANRLFRLDRILPAPTTNIHE
ncbi:MAG: WYL domain-containing protein [Planctomycetota bacterium]|nr:MAG: WYL domain-containing protein [Planctomycetota bacterium]